MKGGDTAAEKFQRKRPSKKQAAFDPKTGNLLLNGQPVSLEANEQDVLRALVEKGAMTLQNLRNVSCEHPDRVLRKLQTKYPVLKKHITLPGGKGRGGYSTTIRFAD